MTCQPLTQTKGRSGERAFSLVEMLIAAGVATIVLTMTMTIYIFGLRSFAAIGNYAVMDSKSRQALDLMLKEVRQASKVVGFQTTGTTRWLSVASTNAPAATNTFTWDSTTGLFTWAKTGQATRTLLTGCSQWSFGCYLRAPDANGNFVATTDGTRTKLINMSWSCSRTNVWRVNTESVVTAEVVHRNLQQ